MGPSFLKSVRQVGKPFLSQGVLSNIHERIQPAPAVLLLRRALSAQDYQRSTLGVPGWDREQLCGGKESLVLHEHPAAGPRLVLRDVAERAPTLAGSGIDT